MTNVAPPVKMVVHLLLHLMYTQLAPCIYKFSWVAEGDFSSHFESPDILLLESWKDEKEWDEDFGTHAYRHIMNGGQHFLLAITEICLEMPWILQ